MAKLPDVKEGDLITAEFMNSILDELEGLDKRVAALETTGPSGNKVIIERIERVEGSGPIRVRDRIKVVGRNFVIPVSSREVWVGGKEVPPGTFSFESSPTQLIFDVPDVSGLDEGGSTVMVVVTNVNGTASAPMTLRPALSIPQGRVEVTYVTPPVMLISAPNITGGTQYVFAFAVTTFVNREATYTLKPTITGSGTWLATLLQEASDQPRTNNFITIPAGITGVRRDIRVKVTVPTGQPNGVIGMLRLDVTENTPTSQVNPDHDEIAIKIGSPPPTPETRVRLSLRSVTGVQIVGSKVQFTPNAPGAITFNILLTEGGTYAVAATMRNAVGWTSQGVDLPTFNVVDPTPGTTTDQDISVILTPGATATDTDLLLSVTRAGTGASAISVQYAQSVTVLG